VICDLDDNVNKKVHSFKIYVCMIQRNVKCSRQNFNTTSVLQHSAILWVVILLCGIEAQGVNNAQKRKIVS
jgi:hypothetical protein